MAVGTGGDGKLHYSNNNGVKYSDYWDWFDNGPGSESWKRKLREDNKKHPIKPMFYPFIPKSESEIKEIKKENSPDKNPPEYITDEDLEIDV